jgi:hypothetical protein
MKSRRVGWAKQVACLLYYYSFIISMDPYIAGTPADTEIVNENKTNHINYKNINRLHIYNQLHN